MKVYHALLMLQTETESGQREVDDTGDAPSNPYRTLSSGPCVWRRAPFWYGSVPEVILRASTFQYLFSRLRYRDKRGGRVRWGNHLTRADISWLVEPQTAPVGNPLSLSSLSSSYDYFLDPVTFFENYLEPETTPCVSGGYQNNTNQRRKNT